tara:strand:+ start:274 stop:459 length:186 start_codon:yes stop_codon:yes gene_type:complete
MKFYAIQINENIKYYKNLKKLAVAENLPYDNIYYHLLRKKISDTWQSKDLTVKVWICVFTL